MAEEACRFQVSALKNPPLTLYYSLFSWLLYMLRVFPRALAAVFARLLGVGLFFVQFLEW